MFDEYAMTYSTDNVHVIHIPNCIDVPVPIIYQIIQNTCKQCKTEEQLF